MTSLDRWDIMGKMLLDDSWMKEGIYRVRQVDFENGKVTRNIFQTMVPLLVAQLLNLLYNIVDRVYIRENPGRRNQCSGWRRAVLSNHHPYHWLYKYVWHGWITAVFHDCYRYESLYQCPGISANWHDIRCHWGNIQLSCSAPTLWCRWPAIVCCLHSVEKFMFLL